MKSLIKTMFFTLSIIILNSPLHAMKTDKNPQSTFQNVYQIPKAVLKSYAQLYSTAFTLTFTHELGHWIANKALLNRKGVIVINPFQILPFDGCMVSLKTPLRSMFNKIIQSKNVPETVKHLRSMNDLKPSFKQGLMAFAGPVFGILGSLGFLKGNTLYTEYQRNGKQFGPAFLYSIKKPLFNKDQSIITQVTTAYTILLNFQNLSPLEKDLDGYKMLKGFFIELNPYRRKIIKRALLTGNIFLGGLLSSLILKSSYN